MAVRDKNLFAWQAYVLTATIVSVLLLVGVFFLWRSLSDAEKKLTAVTNDLSTARQEFQTSSSRVDRLLSMLGKGEFTQQDMDDMREKFKADEKLAEVEKEFAEQMKLFAPNDPTNEKNLIKLPQYLLDTIRIRNEQVDKARIREKELQDQLTETVNRETKAREDAVNAKTKAENDLAQARESHKLAIEKLNSEKEEAIKKYKAYASDFDQKLAKLSSENQALLAKSKEQEATIATQSEIINQFRSPDFASPQGKIVRTFNGGSSVWINLGSDDGLRVGTPFSVIDESEVVISDATTKAKLVITDVVSGNMSRAEVQDYDYRNPILTNDKVYSPAWRPGRTVSFALVGLMDLNGDKRDDLEQVRELIRIAGGKVDDQLTSRGAREKDGEGMTANTSFLVIGTDVKLTSTDNPLAQERSKQYADFLAEARGKGLIPISLDKLMGYLKAEDSNRLVPLGDRIRGEDFPYRTSTTPPASSGQVSDLYDKFQTRSPQD